MKYEHNYARHVIFVRIYLDTVDAYPNDVQSKKKIKQTKIHREMYGMGT